MMASGKTFLKTVMAAVASALARVYLPGYLVSRALLGRQRAFRLCCQRVSRAGGLWGCYLRRGVLRMLGADVAADCHIEPFTLFSSPDLSIGPRVYIGAFCSLGSVSLGAGTLVADGVRIPSGGRQHLDADDNAPFADATGTTRRVVIGRNCWIGANAVVMADLADDCLVAAGAVVTRPAPPATRLAGVPARPMRNSRKEE